jgi:hypothetical protein
MTRHRIEEELKNQLNEVDEKLRNAQRLDSTACFGSAVGLGVALSITTCQVLLIIGMTTFGIIVNLAAKWLLTKKRP